MTPASIIDGATAWRVARADRLAFLVEAAAYFPAFADAVAKARRSVTILAWDIDSRVRLRRDGEVVAGRPETLAEVLEGALAANPQLEVRVLAWKPAAIYTFEREFFQTLKLEWLTDSRFHFKVDARYPPHTSLHEKVVVVDDEVAFLGGIDLTLRRWDTSAHRRDEVERVSAHGDHYRPFHDLHAVVSGEAARVLAEHARERWRRATGEELRAAAAGDGDPWPGGVEPVLRDVDVGIARTAAEWDGFPAVRETETFHLRAIEAARESVYIENQYVGAYEIRDALADRLAGPSPPEVVVVSPRENSGWLETATMGALRAKFVSRLREADPGGRVAAVYPVKDGDVAPNIHSKLMIVDDRLAYLGSANLSNRSMRVDSEVGLVIDAAGRDDVAQALTALRNRLLGEHLGVGTAALERRLAGDASLVRAVAELGSGRSGVRPIETDRPQWTDAFEAIAAVADPEEVVTLERIADGFFSDGHLPETR